jgi:hypothetical protein
VPRKNTSGYLGASWHKDASKWGAYIRRDGKRRYLGLFSTAEEAHAAYLKAAAEMTIGRPDARTVVLNAVRALYQQHGPEALGTPALTKAGFDHGRLRRVGLNRTDLLNELGLAEEYARWRATEFTYAGQRKPRWTWETAVATACQLKDREGDLPTVQWCRLNGYSQLTNFIHKSGRTWEELRFEIGLPASSNYFGSRCGIRWRSRPEASLSNFLYARGVEHKRGERYAADYAEESGRHRGHYDLHFRSVSGDWINVEIWGDLTDAMTRNRYSVTRALKESYHVNKSFFLGIQYQDCLLDARLTDILSHYIGNIAPHQFDYPRDHIIQTAHWSDADELLEACRQFAAQMPDGIFPGDEWLRKRGRYADRPGEAFATLATRVTQWLGGTRQVRELLGHGEASTTAWTRDKAIAAWREFERVHGISPSQAKGRRQRAALAPSVVREAQKICAAADRLGALEEARKGQRAGVKWTPERVISEWREFQRQHGLSPSQAMSAKWRRELPREVANLGAQIYGAALRLGVIAAAMDRD